MSDVDKVLNTLIFLFKSTFARDRMCRLVQYAARVALVLFPSETKYAKLFASMESGRKILRFGRSIPVLLAIQNLSAEKKKAERFRFISRSFLLCFLLLDHYRFLISAGLVHHEPSFVRKMDRVANAFWLGESVLEACAGIESLSQGIRIACDIVLALHELSQGQLSALFSGAAGAVSSTIQLITLVSDRK